MLVEPYVGCHERHVRHLDVIFSLPWAMKKRIWAVESIGFRMKCVFLLLFVLKKSYSVVFAIICRHISLRNMGKWLFVAKVAKCYGIRNVCTVIFCYDTWIWWLVSHIEIFGFQYWRCFVILDHDAFVRPYCNASSLQNLLILLSRSFLTTEDRKIDSMSFIPHQENTYFLCRRWYSTHVGKVRILVERPFFMKFKQ